MRQLHSMFILDAEQFKRKRGRLLLFILLFPLLFSLFAPHTYAQAAESESEYGINTPDVPDNNGFPGGYYREPSSFDSYVEYYDYCKQMYNEGYMTADFAWTPEAYAYAMSQTDENYEKLQESLKKRKAEMTGEDDGNAAEETNEDAAPGDGQAPGPDVKMTESSTEKETEMSQESKNVNAVLRSVIIMVILVAIIMFASFYAKSKKREG